MSMAHKAFLFDTETFHSTIEPVMKACVANPEAARKYICEHYSQFQSPYTGEVLDEDWEDEFDSPTLQVYFDILLTACYDVDDDMGLEYMWDAVNDLIAELDVFDDSQVAVLGRELIIGDVQVDPGMMGLRLVDGSEVPGIRDVLCNHRDDVGKIELDNLSDDVEPEECIEAYDDLCNLYEEAADQSKGLLFAF